MESVDNRVTIGENGVVSVDGASTRWSLTYCKHVDLWVFTDGRSLPWEFDTKAAAEEHIASIAVQDLID